MAQQTQTHASPIPRGKKGELIIPSICVNISNTYFISLLFDQNMLIQYFLSSSQRIMDKVIYPKADGPLEIQGLPPKDPPVDLSKA